MTQSYVMQLHWLEQAMRRSQGEPRVESYEYRQWQERRRIEAGSGQDGAGQAARQGAEPQAR